MSKPSQSDHERRDGAAPKPSRSPLVIVLAVLCGLLVLALLFMIGRLSATQSNHSAPTPSTAESERTDAGSTRQPDQPAAEESVPPEILELLRAQPKREDGDPFAKGDVEAPVVMVEYSDFSCPFCAQFATKTKPELQKYIEDGTLRVEWRDLAMFPEGRPTAAAARVAAEQGKFWEFHDIAFKDHSGNGHPKYTEDELVAFAEQAKVPDLDRFREKLKDPAYEERVFKDTDETIRSLGLQGTPAFIINDTVISGAQPLEVFTETIEKEAAKAEGK